MKARIEVAEMEIILEIFRKYDVENLMVFG